MATESRRVISVLNGLAAACAEGERGYAAAERIAEDVDLRHIFSAYSRQRRSFGHELRTMVRLFGGDPDTPDIAGGLIHQGWSNLETGDVDGRRSLVLGECERGERAVVERYRAAARDELPADVRAVVARQRAAVKEAHDRIRDLCQAARASR